MAPPEGGGGGGAGGGGAFDLGGGGGGLARFCIRPGCCKVACPVLVLRKKNPPERGL
jgi:hypothetical protein